MHMLCRLSTLHMHTTKCDLTWSLVMRLHLLDLCCINYNTGSVSRRKDTTESGGGKMFGIAGQQRSMIGWTLAIWQRPSSANGNRYWTMWRSRRKWQENCVPNCKTTRRRARNKGVCGRKPRSPWATKCGRKKICLGAGDWPLCRRERDGPIFRRERRVHTHTSFC